MTIALHAGDSPSGRTLGSTTMAVHRGTFSLRWRERLTLGIYTAKIAQSDDAGHSSRATATFLIVPGPSVIGLPLSLTKTGAVSLPVTCLASAGAMCNGAVLADTVRSLRTVHGGPSGPVRVMFAHVGVPAGQTVLVTQRLAAYITRDLRNLHNLEVRVTARLTGMRNTAAVRILDTSG